jgi:hypothetical protein
VGLDRLGPRVSDLMSYKLKLENLSSGEREGERDGLTRSHEVKGACVCPSLNLFYSGYM